MVKRVIPYETLAVFFNSVESATNYLINHDVISAPEMTECPMCNDGTMCKWKDARRRVIRCLRGRRNGCTFQVSVFKETFFANNK